MENVREMKTCGQEVFHFTPESFAETPSPPEFHTLYNLCIHQNGAHDERSDRRCHYWQAFGN